MVGFLTLLKKGGFLFFSIFKKTANFFLTKILIKVVFFPVYKLCFYAKKLARQTKIIPQDNGFSSILVNRLNIHIFLILLAVFVLTNNLRAQGQEQEQATQIQKAILFSFLTREEKNIENIETGNEEQGENLNQSSQDIGEIGVITKPNIISTSPVPRLKTEEYIVRPGDTISNIAEKFNISINTILWENKLTIYSTIKPGQKLIILPLSGLTYKVKNGDTIEKIAKTYQSDPKEIREINEINDDEPIKIGQLLIIPGGKIIQPVYRPSSAVDYLKNIISPSLKKSPAGGHIFPWGQCTWYVAQRRYVPWGGNAKNWLANAKAYGYKIGKTPAAGAIVAIKESWYGHVAYVEAVQGKEIIISEANHLGKGVISKRVLSIYDRRIIGYIY